MKKKQEPSELSRRDFFRQLTSRKSLGLLRALMPLSVKTAMNLAGKGLGAKGPAMGPEEAGLEMNRKKGKGKP